ncbi:unnamed protein product [Prunus armeniaca]|uniref:Uncharacterized protein n=1 Tax=Prunus armeniaca TaxID=36596 RepID=A0A6J5VMP9_PRUAR|nr:unnamed protein product [Prunus armeniaca]CAB4320609.1 unnamed protein product [Prunus armeniaca]
MNWEYVTENLLPREISAALRRIISVQKSLGINVNVLPLKENVNVLAKAFKKTGSALNNRWLKLHKVKLDPWMAHIVTEVTSQRILIASWKYLRVS